MSVTLKERRLGGAITDGSNSSEARRLVESPASAHPLRRVGARRSRILLCLFAVAGVGVFAGVVPMTVRSLGGTDSPFVFYTVVRSDLGITVTEGGSLQSQNETEIVCEVENFSYDRAGVTGGTQILFIVPNGQIIEKGDLLVELDSSALRERIHMQSLKLQEDENQYIQAKLEYDKQVTQNETSLANAKLALALAEMRLEMYDDEHEIARQELELAIEEAQDQIAESQATLIMQNTELKGIEILYRLGYRSKGDLQQAQLSRLKAEGSVSRCSNSLRNGVASLKKLDQYDYRMQKMQLEAALDAAKRNLKQVDLVNKAELAQRLANRADAEEEELGERRHLQRYESQLEHCRICAPNAGMVTYAIPDGGARGSMIGEGAIVRQRQKILTLPDLTCMQVRIAVHESVLREIIKGLAATIHIDAFPNRTYRGTVRSVAVLPNQADLLSSEIKVYETIVSIDEEVEELKPGMTAVVDIHVDRLKDVLSVPVQAIVQIERDNWCYVDSSGAVERRMLQLGRTNDKFIEVSNGLDEGDRVVLNPMAVVDEAQERRPVIAPEADLYEAVEMDEEVARPSDETRSSKEHA